MANRRVIVQEIVSVDGFVADVGGGIDRGVDELQLSVLPMVSLRQAVTR